ncbi:MAG: tRNA pseudouridine synthase B [Candidatus Campbellbacteria bacterium GW2011_GWD1_35_49]|nr:MAG: tRNA pseudouridine synthase B, tRNA pseudouridine55 synthase [Candidatus Campbellbacteria bacterium GW2011_OD1_34_28]KKP74797.1 MAG: tRNA pseudouridine synthase B [Candidatus Campbellbacteria bacterium GW2011_GWD2_35_24]KKP75683.1 MAG: tRNA pseudouridine synthase B, tRNA pseudouridine55 synthase [Candidatus Campbellbacteria bacterium GW2011_GWC2_35_28]KKP77069.1 MAG: tRNA pseudouridine synthase B [Candidatus Campbellbacteria bacterium GW2011_GWC1_35_31]KKP78995.1 MAG: tRNA pseudouridine
MIFELYKKEGETPLEAIEKFRKENVRFGDQKMTYAGRLDPMAEGVLLVLVGEECKNKDEYLGLDKEYEFEILWGFQTDTYDVLGIPKQTGSDPVLKKFKNFEFSNSLKNKIVNLKGKFIQKYPPYSSMTVKGKQLFQWAREGRLNEIEIPDAEIEIYEAEFLENRKIEKEELLKNILSRIEKIKGDFRQEEIKKEWKNILNNNLDVRVPSEFVISKFRIKCSSGTYVRGIANELGGIAYGIKRTRIFI